MKIVSILLKISFSILLTLGLVEIGLRQLPGIIPLDLLVYFDGAPRGQIARARGLAAKDQDTILLPRDDGGPPLYILKPHTRLVWPVRARNETIAVEMDQNGFCNPPRLATLEEVEVVTLGDSFTFCHAVYPHETWSAQLANLTGHSVYNLGRVAIGVREYLQILKQFGLAKSPKLVILNIYGGNDLRDVDDFFEYRSEHQENQDEQEQEVEATETAMASRQLDEDDVRELFETHSYSYNLFFAFYRYAQDQFGWFGQSPIPKRNFRYRLVFDNGAVVEFNPYNTDFDEIEYAYLLRERQLSLEVEWALERGLKQFVTLARQHNFTPVVTYTPSAHIAYQANVKFKDPKLRTSMPWFDREQRAFLQTMSQELGYTFIDLTPALQNAAARYGPDPLLYYYTDLHLTPAGHRVVAEALAATLQTLQR